MNELNDPLLLEFLDLPDPVIKWYERLALQACYEQGQPYDFLTHWNSMPDTEKRKIIAMLLKEAFPDTPCPKVKLSGRAGSLKVPSLKKNEAIQISIDDPQDESTEKVKQILLTRSKVRFIGEEGSGKTSKARWLCRERLALGHQIFWINPHLKAEDKQKLDACNVGIVGGGRDYKAIARFCTKMVDGETSELGKAYKRYGSEVNAKFAPVTIVLDELTNYKEEVGEPIEKLIKASMQEFSKVNWHTIYVVHNDTLSCMGAPAGTANLIKSSVFDLKLEADPLKGNRVPKAIAKYRMPNSDVWQDVTIPVEWQ